MHQVSINTVNSTSVVDMIRDHIVWLVENGFKRVQNASEMRWNPFPMKAYALQPSYGSSLETVELRYFFREADHAVLFKLAWCGV